MIILSRLADYAVIIATHLAETAPAQLNAMHLAADTRLPPATVSKVLKLLARAGIVTASIAQIVGAIDGAPAMTQCEGAAHPCDRVQFCPTRPHWGRINQAVEAALDDVKLDEMIRPVPPAFRMVGPVLNEVAAS